MQNLFDTAERRESANRATAVRSLNHVNVRMPAWGPTQILLSMPCAGPVQQEGLAQILRQRKASEYRKTRRGQSPWRALCPDPRTAPGPHKDKKAPARRATPIRPPRRTMSQDAERPARDDPPCGTCSPHDAGRGPYAPQRRLGCPRRRYLPKTRRGPQGLSPCGPLSAHAARAAPGARTAP